jgi:hypothetical protein
MVRRYPGEGFVYVEVDPVEGPDDEVALSGEYQVFDHIDAAIEAAAFEDPMEVWAHPECYERQDWRSCASFLWDRDADSEEWGTLNW